MMRPFNSPAVSLAKIADSLSAESSIGRENLFLYFTPHTSSFPSFMIFEVGKVRQKICTQDLD